MAEGSSSQELTTIKDNLINPRQISKIHDQEGRNQTAKMASESRSKSREIRGVIEDKQSEVEQLREQSISLHKERFEKDRELKDRLNKRVVKLKILVGRGDKKAEQLQEELSAIQSENNELFGRVFETDQEIEELKGQREKIADPKKTVSEYYENVKTLPLTNQEKREMLKPELLENLTTEEYIALWRRMNPFFLTHVTRQGFRDHNAMVYHSGGMQEFHNGMVSVLDDDKQLRPPLAVRGLRARDKQTVHDYLNGWVLEGKDEAEARDRLRRLLNATLASAPNYPDKTAVHFAAQLVGDGFYGGETGNEAFFVFPSDTIASQYTFAFNGGERDFTKPQSETKWNDVFVWPQSLDNPGLPIDAGFVFLPKDTLVDSTTGSKYASETKDVDGKEKTVMVEDTALVDKFAAWGVAGLSAESPIAKAFQDYRQGGYYMEQVNKRVLFSVMESELQNVGFSLDAAQALSVKLYGEMYWKKDFDEEALKFVVRESGANWKRAENTIPARDYWEAYFEKNPSLRPKHIVYYDGDPTNAVYAFEQENGIGKVNSSTGEGILLGFDDNLVDDMENDPRANRGYEDLLRTGDEIIAEKFSS